MHEPPGPDGPLSLLSGLFLASGLVRGDMLPSSGYSGIDKADSVPPSPSVPVEFSLTLGS